MMDFGKAATDREIQEALDKLSTHYHIPATWMRRPAAEERDDVPPHVGRGAYTNLLDRQIIFGSRATIAQVVHEYAHLVNAASDIFDPAHGAGFLRSLIDVANTYYGDPELYPWAEEYPQIRWAHAIATQSLGARS